MPKRTEGKQAELHGIVGRLMNVVIDLQTGVTKAVVAERLREITNDLRAALKTGASE